MSLPWIGAWIGLKDMDGNADGILDTDTAMGMAVDMDINVDMEKGKDMLWLREGKIDRDRKRGYVDTK